MRYRLLPWLAIGLVVLGGCAPISGREDPPMMWVKPGAAQTDLIGDRNACLYDAHKAAPYVAPDSLPVLNLAIECLKSKGWRLVPAGG